MAGSNDGTNGNIRRTRFGFGSNCTASSTAKCWAALTPAFLFFVIEYILLRNSDLTLFFKLHDLTLNSSTRHQAPSHRTATSQCLYPQLNWVAMALRSPAWDSDLWGCLCSTARQSQTKSVLRSLHRPTNSASASGIHLTCKKV